MTTQTFTTTPELQREQERRFAENSAKEAIIRAAKLTERMVLFGQAYCKEQQLSPEEFVFAAALMLVNLRETFPPGKTAFDSITADAAKYYDDNANA